MYISAVIVLPLLILTRFVVFEHITDVIFLFPAQEELQLEGEDVP